MLIDVTTATKEELVEEAKRMIALIEEIYPDKSNRDQVLGELIAIIIALSQK